MKKVIIEQDEKVIRLENITDKMIVGIYDKSQNYEKIFLVKDDDGKSFGMTLVKLKTEKKWKENTHKEYLKEFIKMGYCEVFVFDSPKELAQWLAE